MTDEEELHSRSELKFTSGDNSEKRTSEVRHADAAGIGALACFSANRFPCLALKCCDFSCPLGAVREFSRSLTHVKATIPNGHLVDRPSHFGKDLGGVIIGGAGDGPGLADFEAQWTVEN